MTIRVTDVIATDLLESRSAGADGAEPAPPVRQARASLSAVERLCDDLRLSCNAESAGISVFHHPSYPELTWLAAVGACAPFQGRRYPLRHSMCGVCFDAGTPQLFREAQLYFQWLGLCGIRVAEGLVVPMRTPEGALFGTLWCLTHSADGTLFSRDDVARMETAVPSIYAELCRETQALAALFDAQTAQGQVFTGERRVARGR